MPNWVTNRIKFSNKEAFDRFKTEYVKTVEESNGKTFETFDFNLLIPMPKSLDVEESSIVDQGIDIVLLQMRRDNVPGTLEVRHKVWGNRKKNNPFGFVFGLYTKTDEEIDEEARKFKEAGRLDEVLGKGKQAIQNILDHGAKSWYDWSYENWGTKWNACRYRDVPDELEVWFETAWGTPEPVIAKLIALMGPDAFEAIEYADEDIGCNCGRYYLGDGGPSFPMPYDKQSDEAMECAIRLNNAYEYYELVDGHWVYKEEEEEEEPEDQVHASA